MVSIVGGISIMCKENCLEKESMDEAIKRVRALLKSISSDKEEEPKVTLGHLSDR